MNTFTGRTLIVSLAACGSILAAQSGTKSNQAVIRGWLSDESCARGRASSSIYTGTNPECAKKCVSSGKKIVLIDPEKKRILILKNEAAAAQNVGDYVEITGTTDAGGSAVHVDALKLLEKGRAMCGIPQKKKHGPE